MQVPNQIYFFPFTIQILGSMKYKYIPVPKFHLFSTDEWYGLDTKLYLHFYVFILIIVLITDSNSSKYMLGMGFRCRILVAFSWTLTHFIKKLMAAIAP